MITRRDVGMVLLSAILAVGLFYGLGLRRAVSAHIDLVNALIQVVQGNQVADPRAAEPPGEP